MVDWLFVMRLEGWVLLVSEGWLWVFGDDMF